MGGQLAVVGGSAVAEGRTVGEAVKDRVVAVTASTVAMLVAATVATLVTAISIGAEVTVQPDNKRVRIVARMSSL